MKNFKLNLKGLCRSSQLAVNSDSRTTVERRSNDGHSRRHSPVGLTKLLSLFLLLTLGVGQMWAASETTLYYAISEATLNSELSGHSDYKVYARVNYVGNGDDWASIEMSNTGETYNGDLLFTCTFTDKYSGLGALYFKIGVPESDSGTFSDKIWGNKEWKPFTDTKYNKTIQVHGNLGLSNKKTYAIDKTIYVYDSEGWGTMYLYTYNESHDGSWPGCGPDVSPYHVTSLGSGWYEVKIVGAANFILNNGQSGGTEKKTGDLDNDEDFAKWGSYTNASTPAEKKLTASFNMQLHGSAISDQSINYNGKISEPSEPSATGYTFGGWYEEAGCSNQWNFNTTITADKELFAKWTAKTTTVTLKPNGATTGSDQVVTATYDDDMPTTTTSSTTVTAPSKTGYTFGGYYDTDASSGGTQYYTNAASPASARTWNKDATTSTLYARWTANTYTADNNLNKNNSDASGSSNGKYTATYGATTIAIYPAPTRKGYRVEGYYQEAECTHKIADASRNLQPNTDYTDADGKWNVTSNQTLYVNWTPNWYIFGKGAEFGNETTDWSEGAMTYSASNTVQAVLTLTAGTTYEFKIYKNGGTYWNNATDITSSKVTASVSGKKLYYSDSRFMSFVTSASGNYTFTLNIADESSDGGPVLSITYPSGTTYTVTYGSKSVYNGGASSDNSTTGGSVDAIDNYSKSLGSGKKILSGGSVVFTATPATGYTFEGWYSNVACTEGNEYAATTGVAIDDAAKTLTLSSISADKTVYAKFVEKMATVTITANDGSKGTVTVGGASHTWGNSVNVGVTTTKSLSVTAAAGYYFAGWERTGTLDFNVDDASAATSDAAKVTTLRGLGSTNGTEGALTARFEELDKIYFRNGNATGESLWEDEGNRVYVYFWAYWTSESAGAGANGKHYREMTRIDGTNIYWAYVPRIITATTGASDKSHVAFSSRDWGTYDNFSGGGFAAYRSDYNRILNMFVPQNVQTHYINYGVTYNNKGYWMKYDTKAGEGAGYYWQRWTDAGSDTYDQVAEMVTTTDNATTLKFTITIDDISTSNNKYIIKSAGGLKYWPKVGESVQDITPSNCTNLNLFEDGGPHPSFVFTPTIKGDYTFTLDQTGDVMKFSVEYPETPTNGYRLKHTYNDGSAKTTYSNIISATDATSGANTVSMFLSNGETETLVLQKCTGVDGSGNLKWSTGNSDNLSAALAAGATPGVYVFDITIDPSTDKVTTATTPSAYTGDYYIHVNATTRNNLNNGDPKAGSAVGNKFTKFLTNTTFGDTYDHYWVDWFIGTSDGGGAQVVAATIGNGINDDLAGKVGAGKSTTTDGANVRYGYNSLTNDFTYAMIEGDGASIKIQGKEEGRVLIYDGSAYQDSYSTARSATDADNWMYKFEAKVKLGSQATITTSYNGTPETLAEDKTLLGSTKEDAEFGVEITYDFKTNRLIAAWKPDPKDNINEAIDLYSNLMVVRTENGNPTLLNLAGEGALKNITQVYTVMEFTKANWDASNRTITSSGYTDAYYWISLPYDCKVSDIFGIEGYGSDGYWVIQTYHGDYRARDGWWAETESWWYDLDRTDMMKANQGYVLRLTNLESTGAPFTRTGVNTLRLYFPSSNAANINIGLLTGEVSYTLDPMRCDKWRGTNAGNPRYDRRAIDSNWRIIGSPSFNTAKITRPTFTTGSYPTTPTGYELKYFYKWSVSANVPVYTITPTSDFEFKATHAYLVQYEGEIVWDAVTSNPLVGVKAAPARDNEEQGDRTLKMVLNKDGEQADVTYISRMAEGATEGYDLNLDLSKLLSNSGNNLYTLAGYYKMAGNCLPETTTTVPVGVQIAAEGEYTFSMPEGTNGVGAVLIDNIAGTRTNLALTDYTVQLPAGQTDNRFVLELSPISNVATGDLTPTLSQGEGEKAHKALIDGVLYIVKDGQVFDARGNKVK